MWQEKNEAFSQRHQTKGWKVELNNPTSPFLYDRHVLMVSTWSPRLKVQYRNCCWVSPSASPCTIHYAKAQLGWFIKGAIGSLGLHLLVGDWGFMAGIVSFKCTEFIVSFKSTLIDMTQWTKKILYTFLQMSHHVYLKLHIVHTAFFFLVIHVCIFWRCGNE